MKTETGGNDSANGRYTVRLAESRADIESALRLRFQVFNLELGEGLVESFANGMDEDPFDAVCDHLLISESASGAIIGTYRLQTGTSAGVNLGYYSEREFDLEPFERIRSEVVELGRACVHRDFRSVTVVGLLWREIIRYTIARGGRYLIGCSSINSTDPALGHAMFARLSRDSLASADFLTVPRIDFALPPASPLDPCPPPPRLLRAYLGVGAKICGPPALDADFKTIDFLTMLDCFGGTAAATGHFLHRPMRDGA